MNSTRTVVRERPIPFTGPMVRAILEGRKTQTRRLVKGDPHHIRWCPVQPSGRYDGWEDEHGRALPCPYGVPGDRLWVRETWAAHFIWHGARAGEIPNDGRSCLWYRADGEDPHAAVGGCVPGQREPRWRPSIFMKRWMSRIALEITGVRVERLQEITEEDARAEGVKAPWMGADRWDYSGPRTHREAFARLWDEINGKRAPWASNPWVWVIEFRPPAGGGGEG